MIAPHARADRTLAERIVGTWSLVSYVLRHERGEDVHPLGNDAVGFISFQSDGRMSVQMSRRERTPFARPYIIHGTGNELAEAARGYLAYAGPYEVDEDTSTLKHFVEVSLLPNWIGTTQLRVARIEEPLLTLAAPEQRESGQRSARAIITWRRL